MCFDMLHSFIFDDKNPAMSENSILTKHRLVRQSDGSFILVKKISKGQTKRIQSFLDQLKGAKNSLCFTYPQLLTFHSPHELHYTYDEQVAMLSTEEIFAHAETCVLKGKDPCLLPLREIAIHFFKMGEFSSSRILCQKEKLQQISTSILVRLTKKQRKYLAQIHQCPHIQHALSCLGKTDSFERFIHGDYRFNNILFRKKPHTPLLHVVDWEFAGLGPRVYDWCTLLVDYILVYLVHNVETKGKPLRMHWNTVEQLMLLHLRKLYRLYPKEQKTLHQEYYQWLGVQLLLKGIRVICNAAHGDEIAALLFQMGRRFVVEYDRLHEKYGGHYVA